jgi:hypothetical protein
VRQGQVNAQDATFHVLGGTLEVFPASLARFFSRFDVGFFVRHE